MLPPFVYKEEKEKESGDKKVDRLSKKKRIKQSYPSVKKSLTTFSFC
jgi:hypothetical protein